MKRLYLFSCIIFLYSFQWISNIFFVEGRDFYFSSHQLYIKEKNGENYEVNNCRLAVEEECIYCEYYREKVHYHLKFKKDTISAFDKLKNPDFNDLICNTVLDTHTRHWNFWIFDEYSEKSTSELGDASKLNFKSIDEHYNKSFGVSNSYNSFYFQLLHTHEVIVFYYNRIFIARAKD